MAMGLFQFAFHAHLRRTKARPNSLVASGPFLLKPHYQSRVRIILLEKRQQLRAKSQPLMVVKIPRLSHQFKFPSSQSFVILRPRAAIQ